MVGLIDSRLFAERRVQKTNLRSSTISHFSKWETFPPPLPSLWRRFRFSKETAMEKYFLCPFLTVKFSLDFLRPCWPAYWRFVLASNSTHRRIRTTWVPSSVLVGGEGSLKVTWDTPLFQKVGEGVNTPPLSKSNAVRRCCFHPGKKYEL